MNLLANHYPLVNTLKTPLVDPIKKCVFVCAENRAGSEKWISWSTKKNRVPGKSQYERYVPHFFAKTSKKTQVNKFEPCFRIFKCLKMFVQGLILIFGTQLSYLYLEGYKLFVNWLMKKCDFSYSSTRYGCVRRRQRGEQEADHRCNHQQLPKSIFYSFDFYSSAFFCTS